MAKKNKVKEEVIEYGPVFDKDMSYLYNKFIINDDVYNLVGTRTPDGTFFASDAIDEIKNTKNGTRYNISRGTMYKNFLEGKIKAFGDKNVFVNKSKKR